MTFLLCVSKGCLNIKKRLVDVELLHEGDGALHVRALVGKLHVSLDPVEDGRSDGQKAIFRIAVGYIANVLIDAEYLLHDDQAADRRSCWSGYIGIQLMAVTGMQFYSFTHGV